MDINEKNAIISLGVLRTAGLQMVKTWILRNDQYEAEDAEGVRAKGREVEDFSSKEMCSVFLHLAPGREVWELFLRCFLKTLDYI